MQTLRREIESDYPKPNTTSSAIEVVPAPADFSVNYLRHSLGVLSTPHLGNLPIQFKIARNNDLAKLITYDLCTQPDNQAKPWLLQNEGKPIKIASPDTTPNKLAAYIPPGENFATVKQSLPENLQAAETPAQLHALLGKAPTYSQFILEQDQKLWKAILESVNSKMGLFGRIIDANGASSTFSQQAPIEDPYSTLVQTAQHLAEAVKPGGNTTPHAGDLIPKIDFTAYVIMLSGAMQATEKPRYDNKGRLVNYHLADENMFNIEYRERLTRNTNRMHQIVVDEVGDPRIPQRISFQLVDARRLRPSPRVKFKSKERRYN